MTGKPYFIDTSKAATGNLITMPIIPPNGTDVHVEKKLLALSVDMY